jgi:GNAT superfamily N-acetyltransferase
MSVEVVGFAPELSPHFESLNRAWIEEYFEIEDADRSVFSDPFKAIVEPGGQIFFVVADGAVLGTCAVMRLSDAVYELAKMAVAAEARGRGYGDLLIESAIEFARQAGAQRLMLLSNTRLGPAIKLYQKHGFRSVPITDTHDYSRVDIQMELEL